MFTAQNLRKTLWPRSVTDTTVMPFKQAHAERADLGAPWPQGMCMIHDRLPTVIICATVALLAG